MIDWYADVVAGFYRLIKGAGLRLYGSVAGFVGLVPAETSDSTTYTLPATAPSADGQSLTSTTSGVTSWSDVSGRLVWGELTSGGGSLAVNHGYVINNSSLVSAFLPPVSAIGDTIKLLNKGAGGWQVQQLLGQVIHFGNKSTTQGIGGSLSSTATFDCIELECITPNTDWVVSSSIGNITVV